MMDTEILDLLENIGQSSVARLSPAVKLGGDTATARRSLVLRAIRGTILPRRLEFTAANGDCLAIEVNSSRVTDVFRVPSGPVPDFETEAREDLVGKMARLISDIACAPAPLELLSQKPDAALEADDVGVTITEIETACRGIELAVEPIVSVVPDVEEPAGDAAGEDEPADQPGSLAQSFFSGAHRFATGRVLADGSDGTSLQTDGVCAPDSELFPDQDLLSRFAADLAGWNKDAEDEISNPQLIVMRPSGGKGTGLAVVHDGEQIAIAIHEARKLGAVVNLWASIEEAGE